MWCIYLKFYCTKIVSLTVIVSVQEEIVNTTVGGYSFSFDLQKLSTILALLWF